MNESGVDIYICMGALYIMHRGSIDRTIDLEGLFVCVCVCNIRNVLEQNCRIEASLEETDLAFDRVKAARLKISTK